MIQANELRVGNLVLIGEDTAIVTCITSEGVSANGEKAAYTYEMFNDISPVVLTEEWLTKTGFVLMEKTYKEHYQGNNSLNFGYPVLYLNKYVYLACNSKGHASGNLFLNGNRIECKYVHQLQNLYFALTGKELTL